MRWLVEQSAEPEKVAEIIRMAGGKVVGRTRLQKMFYLLEASGIVSDFSFEYRHYGPYSDSLSRSITVGAIRGLLHEEEHPASWGGTYSVFTVSPTSSPLASPSQAQPLLHIANEANPIDLELAATAIFLQKQGVPNPWDETQRRKPEKAQHIATAKALCTRLSKLSLPKRLPDPS